MPSLNTLDLSLNKPAIEQERRAGAERHLNEDSAHARSPFTQNLVPLARPFDSSVQDAARVAQKGVIAAFSNTCHRWRLPEASHYVLLGYGGNEFFGEQILYGRLPAPQDARDRAGLVLSISLGLGAIFGESGEAELHWLQTPNARLQNKTPLTFMLEGKMANLFRVLSEVERERGLIG